MKKTLEFGMVYASGMRLVDCVVIVFIPHFICGN